MAVPQMDALSSFNHLDEAVPNWLERLEALSKHTAAKKSEFIAEYARLVKSAKPKRVRSPSMASIHSDKDQSVHLPDVNPSNEVPSAGAEGTGVDPLEAGNRHIYADQVQRKRKPNASLRSGASGPQKFRSKHQVVIYYDAHVQDEFESLVKAIGIARNNLRKGRNALNASRGFRLPTLTKRYDAGSFTSPSLDNIRSVGKSRAAPNLPGASKFGMRTAAARPQDEDEASFMDSDKILEQVQTLFETAAHQFLRDGDCQKEIDSAKSKLSELSGSVKTVAERLKDKAAQQEAADEAEANLSHSQSLSDLGCPSLVTDKSSMDPLELPTFSAKSELPTLTQTLEDMKAHGVTSHSTLPQAGMTIEVDDSSDGGSFRDFDIAQFRASNRLRIRG